MSDFFQKLHDEIKQRHDSLSNTREKLTAELVDHTNTNNFDTLKLTVNAIARCTNIIDELSQLLRITTSIINETNQ